MWDRSKKGEKEWRSGGNTRQRDKTDHIGYPALETGRTSLDSNQRNGYNSKREKKKKKKKQNKTPKKEKKKKQEQKKKKTEKKSAAISEGRWIFSGPWMGSQWEMSP